MLSETKILNLLDDGTNMWIQAQRITLEEDAPAWWYVAWRSGGYQSGDYILVSTIESNPRMQHDPFEWGSRTLILAHQELRECWDIYKSGNTMDVRTLPLFEQFSR